MLLSWPVDAVSIRPHARPLRVSELVRSSPTWFIFIPIPVPIVMHTRRAFQNHLTTALQTSQLLRQFGNFFLCYGLVLIK